MILIEIDFLIVSQYLINKEVERHYHAQIEFLITEVDIRLRFRVLHVAETIDEGEILLSYAGVSHEHHVVGFAPVGVRTHALPGIADVADKLYNRCAHRLRYAL